MYQHDDGSGMLTAIFVAAGLGLVALGWGLYQGYRDDRPADQKGFRDFGLGPRGLLAYSGIVLMVLGGAACLIAVLFSAILR